MSDELFIFLCIVVVASALVGLCCVMFEGTPIARKVNGWVDTLNGERAEDE